MLGTAAGGASVLGTQEKPRHRIRHYIQPSQSPLVQGLCDQVYLLLSNYSDKGLLCGLLLGPGLGALETLNISSFSKSAA